MQRREPSRLMPDAQRGGPPPNVQISNIPRRPRLMTVVADHHPLELTTGDDGFACLQRHLGSPSMKEIGQFVPGGFRMVEVLALVDDIEERDPLLNGFSGVSVGSYPVVSTDVKLAVNALATAVLRGLGAAIHGPYEDGLFLPSGSRADLKGVARNLLAVPGVRHLLEDDVGWADVPPVQVYTSDWYGDLKHSLPSLGRLTKIFL